MTGERERERERGGVALNLLLCLFRIKFQLYFNFVASGPITVCNFGGIIGQESRKDDKVFTTDYLLINVILPSIHFQLSHSCFFLLGALNSYLFLFMWKFPPAKYCPHYNHTPVKIFYIFGPASSRALEDVKLCASLSRAILCSSVSLSQVHINPSIHTPVLIHVCSSGLFFRFPFINVILV